MTYTARDTSIQDGDPVYLVEFVRDGETWRYTNAALDVAALSEVWLSSSIGFGPKMSSRESSKNTVNFEFPKQNTFAQAFLAGRPDAVTSLTVYRGHVGDPDDEWQFWWKGRDIATEYSRNAITIKFDNIMTIAKQSGLQRVYQTGCPHALYQRGCNVERIYFRDEFTVTDVDGANLTLDNIGSYSDNYYRGGVFEASDGTLRFIREHVGTAITLAWPVDGLTTGNHFFSPGCDRTLATCDGLFDNSDNYGGQPWIPGESNNPMGGRSLV